MTCVVQCFVGTTGFFICLHKEQIINPGWSLFDANGDLSTDVLGENQQFEMGLVAHATAFPSPERLVF